MKLQSYVCDAWVDGQGAGEPLVDPTRGSELARASSEGVDLGAAIEHARGVGGQQLKRTTYAERGALLSSLAEVLGEHREAYYRIALENSGNTKADAAVDVDGGIGTLAYYARVGEKLGDARVLVEPGADRLGKDPGFRAMHLWTPIAGAAVHVNAFNFPSWGLWEKAAVAILAGVPVIAKPATATALLSQAMVRHVVEAGVLPPGALSLVCGGGRELMDLVGGGDAVAFTGSADTAVKLRSNANVIASAVRFNVEADSLNVSVLGPDAKPESPEFELFVKELTREMTQKAGQKCTAIRRALVPATLLDEVAQAAEARLAKVVTGDPRDHSVRMGPLVTRAQRDAAWEGIRRLRQEAEPVTGGDEDFEPHGADADAGCFVPPTLLRCRAPATGRAVHEVEVFGPVATLMPYKSQDEAFELAARGGGSLVGSVFSADDGFATQATLALGPTHGRVLIVNEAVAPASAGHGIVMPQCVHGGPGRAGGGEELGGLRGLRFYHQRSAVQASNERLDRLREGAAEVSL